MIVQVWRAVFNISVLYLLFMVCLAFLNMAQIRMIFEWLDPSAMEAQQEVDTIEVRRSTSCLNTLLHYFERRFFSTQDSSIS